MNNTNQSYCFSCLTFIAFVCWSSKTRQGLLFSTRFDVSSSQEEDHLEDETSLKTCAERLSFRESKTGSFIQIRFQRITPISALVVLPPKSWSCRENSLVFFTEHILHQRLTRVHNNKSRESWIPRTSCSAWQSSFSMIPVQRFLFLQTAFALESWRWILFRFSHLNDIDKPREESLREGPKRRLGSLIEGILHAWAWEWQFQQTYNMQRRRNISTEMRNDSCSVNCIFQMRDYSTHGKKRDKVIQDVRQESSSSSSPIMIMMT